MGKVKRLYEAVIEADEWYSDFCRRLTEREYYSISDARKEAIENLLVNPPHDEAFLGAVDAYNPITR